ncbi:MAG: DUF1343 domain-containing protein [Leptospirales bacterium]|nr:DUF1343 domain-containing protein [Leptospirales bacterium]
MNRSSQPYLGALSALASAPQELGQRIGLICNQSSWLRAAQSYLFQSLAQKGILRRLFLPEHGLFAELQDQVALDDVDHYQRLAPGVEIISLYGATEAALQPASDQLLDLDTLLIDLQDVGARYYTFATTVSYAFDVLALAQKKPRIIVVDRPNPAGRLVEGSPLPPSYASFVGRPGLPHRHGLSLGELARFYERQCGVDLDLRFLYADDSPWEIPPSPNMPTALTPLVYSGQCLLEGTNLSEGRGTTRPFEIFGAPFMDFVFQLSPPLQAGAALRPLCFQPTFHKWANELCYGYQIHLDGAPYHSLAHSLKLIRWIRENSARFDWRHGVYEYRSDRPAIELLAGDAIYTDYLLGKRNYAEVREFMEQQEEEWLATASSLRLDERPLRRAAQEPRLDYC